MQTFEILLYSTPEGKASIEVFFERETFWLSQKKMADLFNVDTRTINEHLKNIFKTKELEEQATIRKFRIVQKEGTREVGRDIEFYNLDAIIAVGYRVNLREATAFRIWATNTLKEFIVKGFVLEDSGKITHEIALSLAKKEYEKYRVTQDKNYESDFDKAVKTLKIKKSKGEIHNEEE